MLYKVNAGEFCEVREYASDGADGAEVFKTVVVP